MDFNSILNKRHTNKINTCALTAWTPYILCHDTSGDLIDK